MASIQTYTIGGKAFNIWTEGQLSSINRVALRKRFLDLREHVGQDRLRPMPHQPEDMVAWMLQVQRMAMGANQPAAYQAKEEYAEPYDRGSGGGAAYADYEQEPQSGGYDHGPPFRDQRGPPGAAAYGAYDRDPPSRGCDAAPPVDYDRTPPGGYTPSDAGSIAESRVGALGFKTLVIGGKDWNVSTEKQLSAMGRESLKTRCMDFRDLVGKERLRPMPRHRDAMVDWLLDAEAMVMEGGSNSAPRGPQGGSSLAPMYEDEMAKYAGPGSMARGAPAHGTDPGRRPDPRDYEPSEAPTEAQSNYETSMAQAKAIKLKNQGSIGLW